MCQSQTKVQLITVHVVNFLESYSFVYYTGWVIGNEQVSLPNACFISLQFYPLMASDGRLKGFIIHELFIIFDYPASDIIIDFSFYKSIKCRPNKIWFCKKFCKVPAFYCSLSICRGLWWPVKRVLLGRHCPLQQSTRAVGNVSFLKWIYNWKSEHRFQHKIFGQNNRKSLEKTLLRDNIFMFTWFL